MKKKSYIIYHKEDAKDMAAKFAKEINALYVGTAETKGGVN